MQRIIELWQYIYVYILNIQCIHRVFTFLSASNVGRCLFRGRRKFARETVPCITFTSRHVRNDTNGSDQPSKRTFDRTFEKWRFVIEEANVEDGTLWSNRARWSTRAQLASPLSPSWIGWADPIWVTRPFVCPSLCSFLSTFFASSSFASPTPAILLPSPFIHRAQRSPSSSHSNRILDAGLTIARPISPLGISASQRLFLPPFLPSFFFFPCPLLFALRLNLLFFLFSQFLELRRDMEFFFSLFSFLVYPIFLHEERNSRSLSSRGGRPPALLEEKFSRECHVRLEARAESSSWKIPGAKRLLLSSVVAPSTRIIVDFY